MTGLSHPRQDQLLRSDPPCAGCRTDNTKPSCRGLCGRLATSGERVQREMSRPEATGASGNTRIGRWHAVRHCGQDPLASSRGMPAKHPKRLGPNECDRLTYLDERGKFFLFLPRELPVVVPIHQRLQTSIRLKREPEVGDRFEHGNGGFDHAGHDINGTTAHRKASTTKFRDPFASGVPQQACQHQNKRPKQESAADFSKGPPYAQISRECAMSGSFSLERRGNRKLFYN